MGEGSAICDALLNFRKVPKEKTSHRGLKKSIFTVTSYVDDPLEYDRGGQPKLVFGPQLGNFA